MGIGSWLYTNSTKNLRVKIVHPGGHAELHDRPVLAADIIRRNPKCCVAHPNVFKQPWAIVQPDTMLMPGQKVYVVPVSTVRKLQKLSIKRSISQDGQNGQGFRKLEGEEDEDSDTSCCSVENGDVSVCMNSFNGGNDSEDRKSCFTCMSVGGKRSSGRSVKRTTAASGGGLGNRNQGDSPKKLITDLDYWQPNLHSIVEEKSVQE